MLVVVSVLAIGVIVYQGPAVGRGDDASLLLTGGVDSSQCAPCHLRIAEARRPGLIFGHGAHLMISCAACHWGMPHQSGKTVSPVMDACFNCHGLEHAGQGRIASADCRDCHAASFVLRPRSHVADWAKKPHARASARSANRCLMCHSTQKDCDACHEKERVALDSVRPRTYQPVLPVVGSGPEIRIIPEGGAKMGQCYYCHPDIDDFRQGTVIFEHARHLEKKGIECADCHETFAHANERTDRPSMRSCYRCHGLVHSVKGLVATEKCEACHPKGFELMPANHTKAFLNGGHKEPAKADGVYCAMCHQADFCVKCHMGRRRQPDGAVPRKVIPADHKKAAWRGDHGGKFIAQEGECGVCHDQPSCKTCHTTPMPHPPGWLANHEAEGKAKADCNVCHTNRDRCQRCHHDKVKRKELTEKACTGCHEEMKLGSGTVEERAKRATSIKHKGFAEHAVHFDVTEPGPFQKPRPYLCDECHISFGAGRAGHEGQLRTTHDLRLCYECHDALDYKHVLIAPYRGAQLCARCHTDRVF